MKKPPGICIYESDWTVFEELDYIERGQLITMMYEYFHDGTIPEADGMLRMAFKVMQNKIDTAITHYANKCEKNRKNIKKYWDNVNRTNTNEYEPTRTNTNDNQIEKNEIEMNEIEMNRTTTENTPGGGGGCQPFRLHLNNEPQEAKTIEIETWDESCWWIGMGFASDEQTASQFEALKASYSLAWLKEAAKVAKDAGKPEIGYLKGILRNWRREGGMPSKPGRNDWLDEMEPEMTPEEHFQKVEALKETLRKHY